MLAQRLVCSSSSISSSGNAGANANNADGDGGSADGAEALRWLLSAAELGDAEAMRFLGRMHRSGSHPHVLCAAAAGAMANGVTGAKTSAGRGQAARDPRAPLDGGRERRRADHFRSGGGPREGPLRDLAEAARWFHAASLRGDAASQCLLGDLHASGAVFTDPVALWRRPPGERMRGGDEAAHWYALKRPREGQS